MMRGEKVIVITRTQSGTDPGNAPKWTDTEVEVEDVLIAPGPRSDVVESNRPEGVSVVYNLHFPKAYTGSLRGLRVKVRGEEFYVIGDPKPYQDNLTPGRWNRPVEVERREG